MRKKTKLMVYAALLTALAIIIPIQFSFLRVYIPPFSATLLAHVPMFIGMLIAPFVAVVVGVGSSVGFLLAGMPMPVVFRAMTHIIVGFVGAKLIERKIGFIKVTIMTSILHGGLEALVVIPFIGFDLYELLIVTGLGGIIHHLVDGGISYGIAKSMAKSMRKNIYTMFKVEEKNKQVSV